MPVRTVTYFSTLLRLARAEAQAVASGDAEEIAKAKAAHDAYRQACLDADEMIIGTYGSIA